MTASEHPIYTLGHSSRPLDAFLALLEESRIGCVVDVRRLPGSRAFPQYDADPLSKSLAEAGIRYQHVLPLCGRRTQRELHGRPSEEFWTNASFARYAAWARGAEFSAGLEELIEYARLDRCVVMCAEAVWWRCHRRIIADHLLARCHQVIHILGQHIAVPATLTQGALVHEGKVVYPDPQAAGTDA